MTKALQLRKIIQDRLYPEGVKLEFGVEVKCKETNEIITILEITKGIELRIRDGMYISKGQIKRGMYEILGKPTTLQEILLMIQEEKVEKEYQGVSYHLEGNGRLVERLDGSYDGGGYNENTITNIDLTKSIEKQDSDTIQNLIELIK